METIELKFLLQLLGFEDDRASLAKIKLDSTHCETENEQICRNLCDRGFLVCSYKIHKFKIASPGKFLLKQDADKSLLTKEERQVLKASAKEAITPKETGIPKEQRQAVIRSLADRGLIEVKAKHKTIKDVWLTERGKEYLQYEYEPNETCSALSSELLSNYFQFLRKSFQEVSPLTSIGRQIISDEKILLTIRELDRQLGTDNQLPILYLREKLQPLLSSEELDEALYRLQQSGKIELIAVSAARACVFISGQICTGIEQNGNAPLFFIALR